MKISLPEQVWIDLEPASFGSRALAYLIDFVIRWSSILLIVIAVAFYGDMLQLSMLLKGASSEIVVVIFTLLIFLVEWSYPIYFDVLKNGISPGKKALGLQVVDERGLPITFRASFLRTVLIVVDLMPGIGFVAFCSMMLTKKAQRLGDLVARTLVVHQPETAAARRAAVTDGARLVLPLELYNIMTRFFARESELMPDARERMVQSLVQAAMPHTAGKVTALPQGAAAEEQRRWLRELYEQARPSKLTEARGRSDVTINWKQLAEEFDRAESMFGELQAKPQTEESLLKTAAQYQLICQRYGYLSTFYPESAEARRAAQLVRRGRTLIYSRRLNGEKEGFIQRAHLAFLTIRMHVGVAGAVGVLSAVLTAALVQLNPNLLWHFLSEETAQRLSSGSLWTEQIRGISGIAASQIMTNNISVTLSAFALGVTGGVGTVIILIFNGAHLGGIFSALSFYQMAFPLLDFVVAHGFLELSVIIVAGGCGLYLGDAMLNPGYLTRKKALQRNGSVVVDLLFFNALCLVLAGIVEGYVSPYRELPFAFKLALGIVLGAAYWLFLFTGRRARP